MLIFSWKDIPNLILSKDHVKTTLILSGYGRYRPYKDKFSFNRCQIPLHKLPCTLKQVFAKDERFFYVLPDPAYLYNNIYTTLALILLVSVWKREKSSLGLLQWEFGPRQFYPANLRTVDLHLIGHLGAGSFSNTNIFIVDYTLASQKKYFVKNLELCGPRNLLLVLRQVQQNCSLADLKVVSLHLT